MLMLLSDASMSMLLLLSLWRSDRREDKTSGYELNGRRDVGNSINCFGIGIADELLGMQGNQTWT